MKAKELTAKIAKSLIYFCARCWKMLNLKKKKEEEKLVADMSVPDTMQSSQKPNHTTS